MITALRAVFVTSRPRFWLYLAGPVLVGLVYGATTVDELVSPVTVGLFVYFLIPANVFLYGVNDIFDADIDRLNPKKASRERRFDGELTTIIAVFVSLALGLGVLLAVPPVALPWFLGFFVLGGAYSIQPIRLKRRPVVDSLSNGLYILPGVGAYLVLAGELPPVAIIVGAWLWTMAMHTYSAIPDIDPDRRGGIRTTATVLGQSGALVYCFVVWTLAAGGFALVDVRAGALMALYPLVVLAIARASIAIERAYWWYPAINALVGMTFTLVGLWGMLHA